MSSIMKMSVAALALVSLAISAVVGITILRQMDEVNGTCVDGNGSRCVDLIPSGDITPFIAGLTVFGTFATVLAIVVVGKLVIDMVRGKTE